MFCKHTQIDIFRTGGGNLWKMEPYSEKRMFMPVPSIETKIEQKETQCNKGKDQQFIDAVWQFS